MQLPIGIPEDRVEAENYSCSGSDVCGQWNIGAVIFALMRISEAVMTTGPHLIAFVRTLVICAVALTLAYCGSRWQRKELAWIAYATLAFVAAKLLFEDLRHGQLVFIAASIFLFAVTLILVPRLVRPGQRGSLAVITPIESFSSSTVLAEGSTG